MRLFRLPFLLLLLLAPLVSSCDRVLTAIVTADLASFFYEDERTFHFERDNLWSGYEYPWERSPVVKAFINYGLEEVITTDNIVLTLGIMVQNEVVTGEVDLAVRARVFLTGIEEPDLWEQEPLYEFEMSHITENPVGYYVESAELVEEFYQLLHAADPLNLALEMTMFNAGGGGSYSGSVTADEISLYIKGHKHLE